ncbi:MAG: glycoside hydrolase family 15 protein [Flavitalea sp.]
MSGSNTAPGAPGKKAKWNTGHKSGIGKALDHGSDVSFTISQGYINEVYFPREDMAAIKEIRMIVTDGVEYLSDEQNNTDSATRMFEPGVPAYIIENTCHNGKYILTKEVLTDPFRDVLLQRVKFDPINGEQDQLFLFTSLIPALGNHSSKQSAYFRSYNGTDMIFAESEGLVLAYACSVPFLKRSVGYLGTSDIITDLRAHKHMTWEYDNAPDGSIALGAQIDLSGTNSFTMAVAFGRSVQEAGNLAEASLLAGFDYAHDRYTSAWRNWQESLWHEKDERKETSDLLRTSAAVLKISEARNFPGGMLASLSIPWGDVKEDKEPGGYHLVWPRDLVFTSSGFSALKDYETVHKVINYLMTTQKPDGSWHQNMWIDGAPYWESIQIDQISMPVMLASWCFSKKIINETQMNRYWPRILKALSFMAVHGPESEQDRWEEESGISVFTLATQISAFVAGASLAEAYDQQEIAKYCYETADYLNSKIDEWTYIRNSGLCDEFDVDGYYIRFNPRNELINETQFEEIDIRRPEDRTKDLKVFECVSVDALALVRFGLRAADDPRILNTLKIIDATLKKETPQGTSWYRYTGDAYGEKANGDAYTNIEKGIGRLWPLLNGERGHYEIAAGNMEAANEQLKMMESFAVNGLLPEQVWDTDAIPEKNLYPGLPTGGAMPLTWAHAEYIKLATSIAEGRIYDLPKPIFDRYVVNKTQSNLRIWRFNRQAKFAEAGKTLRVELLAPAIVKWSDDNWETSKETATIDSELGLHIADLPIVTESCSSIQFTFCWKETNKWEEKNFTVNVISTDHYHEVIRKAV